MNNSKMKNLHYLNRYINLDSLMKDVLDNVEEGKASEGLLKLKEFINTLALELVRYNSLFKDGPIRDFDTTLNELYKRKLLSEDQKDLLYSINCYNMLKEDKDTNRQNLEALKNFCVRIDNELPFIMASLGVGGSKRNDFRKEQDIHVEKPKTPIKNNEISNVKVKEKIEDSFKKTKVPLSYKLKKAYNSTPAFIIRFIVVGATAGILVYFTFINKLTSEILDDFFSSELSEANYLWQYIAVSIPEAFIGLLGNIFNGIGGIFNFLKFE